jgi:phage tail-like protein
MRPFTTFNFKVKLWVGDNSREVCKCEFSECDGLEMNIEPKTIREGGNNGRQIHLMGPVAYGQLTLKRGMTTNFDLWRWFRQVQQERNVRASGEIQMLASDRTGVDVRFTLTGCLPIKLKAPALSAKDGEVAIEEMQIAYEMLDLPAAAEGGA